MSMVAEMDISWSTYKKRFRRDAARDNKSEEYVAACLAYAEPIWRESIPPIFDQHHLSRLLGYNEHYLYGITNMPRRYYRIFNISKASGGMRQIEEPLPSLKEIQDWILRNILDHLSPSKYAKAYRKGFSLMDNARFHRGQSVLLKMDIKDFFPSVTYKKVFGVFRRCGYTIDVSTMLAKLCCIHDRLPQGSPASPAISNLVMKRVDARLGGYCRARSIRYTRYADDLAFSGSFKPSPLIHFTSTVLQDDGYRPNKRKTRVLLPHQRQMVTGVVVNNRKARVPRETRRDLRKILHYMEQFGVDDHLEHIGETRGNYIEHCRGIANWVLSIDPDDSIARKVLLYLGRH